MKRFSFLLLLLFPVLAGFMGGAILAKPADDIYVSVSTDQLIYRANQPLAVAITLLNLKKQAFETQLANSQVYDLYLSNAQGDLVWKWSGGKMFAMALVNYKLEPGNPVSYVLLVNPELAGKPLPAGKYQLVGVFCAKQKICSKPLDIEIR